MGPMCRLSLLVGSGMYPSMFENQMKRNSVPMKVNHFTAMRWFMFPSVMLLRMRP